VVPTRSFAYELSAHVTNHSINGVEGLDNTDRTQFSGFSTDLRYLTIGRGPGHANSLLRDAVGLFVGLKVAALAPYVSSREASWRSGHRKEFDESAGLDAARRMTRTPYLAPVFPA